MGVTKNVCAVAVVRSLPPQLGDKTLGYYRFPLKFQTLEKLDERFGSETSSRLQGTGRDA